MEKYYIKTQTGASRSIGIVKLTDKEYKIVKEFLDAPYNVTDEMWCGDCCISEQGYDTYNEAVEAALKRD